MTPKTSAGPALIQAARTSKTAGPALFRTVRASRDVTLVAFGGALLTAFALLGGAFLPRLGAPAAAPAVERAPHRAAPSFVASHRPGAPGEAAAATVAPCETETPRG